MELRKGYKQTEVGVIPEDWNVAKIGSLAKIQRGASPRPIDSPIWFDRESTTGWLRISDVTKSDKYLFQTMQKLSGLGIENSRFVASNSLVMSICATVGRPILTCMDVCIHDGFVVFRELKADKEYLYYVLTDIESDWSKHGQTGSQMNLNTSLINSTLIPLPPAKTEQTAISKALSDADAWIQLLTFLIAKKSQIKHGAMQALLTGQKRLPEFRCGKKYKQTAIGEIPEDWEVNSLLSMLKEIPKYGINAAAVKLEGSLPAYIRITDISEDGYYLPTEKVGVDNVFSSNYVLAEGDLVFARTGASVGKSYLYNSKDGELVYAGFLIKISPDNQILLSKYLSQYVKTQIYWNWVKVMSMRSGQPGINGNEYGQLMVPLPPTKAEQTAIVSILSDMDNEILALKSKLVKAQEIKQGMMQTLLTGRIRLI